MDDSYYQRDYKIKASFREKLEAKLGKTKFTHNEIEIFMTKVFKGEIDGKKGYTLDKMEQLERYLKEIHVNSYDLEHLTNVSVFMKNVFTKEQIVDIVKINIDRVYKPGGVYQMYRIANDHIIHFYSEFEDFIDLCDAIVINPTYIADVKKILPDVEADKSTGAIIDEDADERIYEHLKGLRLDFNDLRIGKVDGNYAIASTTPSLIKYISSEMGNIQFSRVPKYKFSWV